MNEIQVFFERAKVKYEDSVRLYPEIAEIAGPLFLESLSNVERYLKLDPFPISLKFANAYRAIWSRFLWNIESEDRRVRELKHLEYCCTHARMMHENYLKNESNYIEMRSKFPEIDTLLAATR